MKDIVSSLWGSIGGFVGAWLVPSLLAAVYISEVLLPALNTPWTLGGAEDLDRYLVIGFGALVLAFVLASASTPLTRALEGYYLWPPKLRHWRVSRHAAKRKKLLDRIDAGTSKNLMLDRERLNAYPRQKGLVLPTRLGNALRAGESYGWVQYGFSVPDLWVHLTAVAGDDINAQLQQSRAVVDFNVAALWLSVALAISTSAWVVLDASAAGVIWLLIFVLAVPFWYMRAVGSVAWYARSMWALADLNRGELAERLGIRLPGSIHEERELWKAVSEYAAWGPGWQKTPNWIAAIDNSLTPRGASDPAPDA